MEIILAYFIRRNWWNSCINRKINIYILKITHPIDTIKTRIQVINEEKFSAKAGGV